MKRSRSVALHGMLVALALVLCWLESQLPVFFAVPGMKLGLSNLVVVLALYLRSGRSAVGINVLRMVLVGLLFGNGVSLLYSLAGGLLSGGVMLLARRLGWFSLVTVSVVGGIAHNLGQILVAMVLLGTTAIGWYLPVLWFAGLGSGAVIGILGGILCRRLSPVTGKGETL